jgi:MFS family permease
LHPSCPFRHWLFPVPSGEILCNHIARKRTKEIVRVEMRILWVVLAFVLAVVVTTVVGTIAHTQFVLGRLTDLGIAVPFSERLSMTLHDVVGMGPMFGAIIGLGFLVAMAAGALVFWFAGVQRFLIYAVAGAVAVAVALTAMGMVYDITPIAGARSTAGFVAQMIAGALGGLVFARLSAQRAA